MVHPEDSSPPAATEDQRRVFDAFVVVLGIVVSLATCTAAREQENRHSLDQLRRLADDHARAAETEFQNQLLVLEAVRAFWNSSQSVERDEFAAFTAPLLEGYPGLEAIEWIAVVPAREREAFEQRAASGLPDFRIHERSPDGRAVPAGLRKTYYPVLYAEPPRGAAAAAGPARPGFDHGSEPEQLAALQEAITSGQPRTSGPFARQEPSQPQGGAYRTALPVFGGRGTPVSAAERSRSLRGFVLGTFSLESIFAPSLAPLPVSFEVVDAGGRRVLRSPPDGAAITPATANTLDLGGMRWTVRGMRGERLGGPQHTLSWLLLGFGLLLTGLLALHLRSGRGRSLELARSNRELTLQAREREAAEARGRETQRALATLLSNLPGMAYRCLNDQDWTMEFVSDGCLPLTGYHPEELLPGPVKFGHIIHPEDRAKLWSAVQRSIREREVFQLVYRIVTRGGETRWVWEQGRGVFDDSGRLEVLEGFITDITAQKTAEQGLRKEKHFSDTAIDSLPGVFYLFDSDGHYLRWNRNLELVSGYSRAELAEIQPLQLIAPEERERVAARIEEVFETGSSTAEAHLYTRDGNRIPYFFTGQRLTLDDKLCLLGMGVDVTDRVLAEEERQAIQRKVLETQKLESIGLLAGGIAHDFNNLLTAIVGNLGFARARIPADSPALDFVGLAEQAVARAGNLTQQLLAYTGHATLERLPIDLSARIRELVHLLTSSISKKVALELALGADLPAVEADPAQIQQVAMNLVLNGAEACGDRPGVVRVRTETRTLEGGQVRDPQGEPLPAGRYVSLVVEDTGCGMDAASRAKIFDPFYTTKFTGRGLGLAAVLGIVRGHGGALEVRSSPGNGSSFEVFLPASDQPVRTLQPVVAQDLTGQGRILVADDEPAVLEVVRRTLTECGYEVLEACNGRQAVDLFLRHGAEIDLVLLDMTMPEMNGVEALAAIHALRPDVPSLLSSGYDEEQMTSHALGAGLAGFIQKPYPPAALAAKVKQILAGAP